MKMNKSMAASLVALMTTGVSFGAASVSWLSPPDGASFTAGTVVQPNGAAAGTGTVGGTGLDLAFVLDSSGSMSGQRQAAQAAAAKALVDALPAATTSVAVIEFDSLASTVVGLTPLSPASGISTVKNAIDAVDASGGTNIPSGMNLAAQVLNNQGDPNRTQMMVVMSDGSTSGDVNIAANSATTAAGVDAIHSVGLPGHSVGTMRNIADGPDNVLGNTDDIGIYTDASNLSQLEALFNGTGGNLVGLQQVDVTLPDGTVYTNVSTDGVGNFTVPSGYALALGPNVFTATATATDGSTASQTLTLFGTAPTTGVPDGGATLTLLGLALAGLSLAKKTKRA